MKHRSWRKTAYQPTSLIAGVLLLLVVFVTVGYFFLLTEPGLSTERVAMLAELHERRAQWLDKRPPAFRYKVERDCECPLEHREPFTVVEDIDGRDNHPWIDGFFTSLEEAIQSAESVAIGYDPRFSYPNDFRIDEEQTYVRDFEVLEYAQEGR